MAREEFERIMTVASGHDQAWSVLTDPDQVVGWVNIIHSIREVEHLKRYTAILEDKVGPFRLRADIAIDVTVPVEGEAVDVTASGRDRAMNSQIQIDAHLRLSDHPERGSTITISGQYTVTGRATTMGGGIVRKKGEAAVDQFVSNAIRTLGPVDASAAEASE